MILANLRQNSKIALGVLAALLLATARVSAADDPVPTPWNGIDIGGPSPAGSASVASGVFTLTGGGGDLAGTNDRFHFVYQSLAGDCTLTARVFTGANSGTPAIAGLMARQALEAGSDFVAVALTPGSGAASFYRTLYAPQTAALTVRGASSPLWVKLVKRGTDMQSFIAADRGGAPGSWSLVGGSQPIPSGMIYVGLCQAGGPQGGTAAFDHVSLVTGPQLVFEDGIYTFGPASAPNMVLVPSGSGVKLAAATGASDQKWRLAGKSGFYSFQSLTDPTLVLTVPGAKTDNGSPVGVSADQRQTNQRWSIAPNTNGTYSLLTQFNPGICLDDFQGSGTPDAVIDIWGFNSADPHLQWTINSAQ